MLFIVVASCALQSQSVVPVVLPAAGTPRADRRAVELSPPVACKTFDACRIFILESYVKHNVCVHAPVVLTSHRPPPTLTPCIRELT